MENKLYLRIVLFVNCISVSALAMEKPDKDDGFIKIGDWKKVENHFPAPNLPNDQIDRIKALANYIITHLPAKQQRPSLKSVLELEFIPVESASPQLRREYKKLEAHLDIMAIGVRTRQPIILDEGKADLSLIVLDIEKKINKAEIQPQIQIKEDALEKILPKKKEPFNPKRKRRLVGTDLKGDANNSGLITALEKRDKRFFVGALMYAEKIQKMRTSYYHLPFKQNLNSPIINKQPEIVMENREEISLELERERIEAYEVYIACRRKRIMDYQTLISNKSHQIVRYDKAPWLMRIFNHYAIRDLKNELQIYREKIKFCENEITNISNKINLSTSGMNDAPKTKSNELGLSQLLEDSPITSQKIK
ncbi:hypothetical protein HYX58_04550 [Candidatus Dependentiae bacterium]|nr:hypothetical protein [Candidatus Dependentiae bacterium]